MTTRKQKPAPYQVGYGKPPLRTRFQKGKSGNPSGRPRRAATERAKALVLKEAYRAVTVRDGDRVASLPAIQAVKRWGVGRSAGATCRRRIAVMQAVEASLLPPPLWGRVGVGGQAVRRRGVLISRPPPPTPPHKGEGRSESCPGWHQISLFGRKIALFAAEQGIDRNALMLRRDRASAPLKTGPNAHDFGNVA
jgi:Family of unknown function (DUF5681)